MFIHNLGVAYNGYDATYGDMYTVVTHGSIYAAGDPNNYCIGWNFSVINPGFTQGNIFKNNNILSGSGLNSSQ